MRKQKAVGEAQGRARPQRGEDLLVRLGLCGIRDQQQDEVRFADNLVHLAQGAVRAVKPAFSACGIEDEPSRRPTFTMMPVPASESRRFCAWAGPCDDQPITPIWRMPSKASGVEERGHGRRERSLHLLLPDAAAAFQTSWS